MPHITVCARCGRLYESASEEAANEPVETGRPDARWCLDCLLSPAFIAGAAATGISAERSPARERWEPFSSRGRDPWTASAATQKSFFAATFV